MLAHPNVEDLEFSLVAQYPICQMTNWLLIIKSKVQKFRQIIPPVQARPEAEIMPCRVFPSVSPKQKNLMSDWLQESESNSVVDDDDVSANYLKGSRSPPGIATHLLRTASSPVKNVCSAKPLAKITLTQTWPTLT